MLNKKPSSLLMIIFLMFPHFCFSQEMWINEFHYDNSSSDVNEFIEVVVEDTYGGSLLDLEIVFYNGSNQAIYNSSHIKTLDTFDVGQTQGGFTIYSKLTSGFQNGPDAIALVNNGTVVEFISYEGVFTAASGPASGLTSVNINVSESSSTPIGHSLQLSGTASHPQDFTWQVPAVATMGVVNNGQTLVDEPPQVSSTFPLNTAIAVASSTAINLAFSESVNVTASSFDISCGGNTSNFSLSNGSNPAHYTLTPDSPWPNSSVCAVTLLASDITDIGASTQQLDGDGNGTPGDNYVFSFTVASDDLATVTTTNPANDEVLVAQNFTIDINFSENVDVLANAVSLDCQGAVSYSGLAELNTNTITITPDSSVAQGVTCNVTLDATKITDLDNDNDLLDGDGDGVAGGNYMFSFTIIEAISEIFEIQGTGSVSPVENDFVRLQDNIVTAVSSVGFFIQTPTIRDDLNINTSNGLFVYLGVAPTVSVGDMVDLRGQAIEYYEFTEISPVSSVTIKSSGHTLPLAIEFDANTPSQDSLNPSCAIEFECYEGMLIHVANGVANTGSQEFSGYDAEIVVTAGGARAFREPGVELSYLSEALTTGGSGYVPDVFDENPELFELDPDALGLDSLSVNGGSTFSATGVLAFSFNDFELWPTQLNFTQREFTPIPPQQSSEITVATQNLYRFFDDIDDPGIDDYQEDGTTTQTFNERTAQASMYFRTVMKSPDIIILVEIENLNAVQAIASKLNTDDSSLQYSAHLVEGNDFGGIDIGILTKGNVSNITVTQLGADEILQYGGTNRDLHDRPPLLINAIVSAGGYSQEVNVLGIHMRSRSGITGSDRERIRNKHLEQSLSVAQMAQDTQIIAADVPLIIIGDFNDFEFSDGYADVTGEIQGVIVEEKNIYRSDGVTIINPVTPRLWNAVDTLPDEEKYSFIFRGIPQALDHAVINDAALALLSEVKYIRGNTDAPAKYSGDYSQVLSLSDHDGLMLSFELIDTNDLIYRNSFE